MSHNYSRRLWLLIISCASFLALIYAARSIFMSVGLGRPVDWDWKRSRRFVNSRPICCFLDVQMPGMNGFEVLQTIGIDAMPAVVFVTAYDKYALQAFEVNAVDYLLKPFDKERFQKAFQRARVQIESRTTAAINQKLQALLDSMRTSERYLERLVVKAGGRIFFLPVSEIDWIESADNYVSLHAGRESHLIRETLTSLEGKLDPEEFLRIRHSAIVNIKRIKELHPLFKGEYEIVLQNGMKLTSSRRYRARLEKLLQH